MRKRRIIQRRRRARRGAAVRWAAGIVLAAAVVMAGLQPEARAFVAARVQACVEAVQAFASDEAAQQEVTLAEMNVFGLQLGVYDSGESAQRELQKLFENGMPCIIWQEAQMRIVCAAALSRETLSNAETLGNESWVFETQLPKVTVRIHADASRIEAIAGLLGLADAAFCDLLNDAQTLEQIVEAVRTRAIEAKSAHPDHLFYTQLAQSLENWAAMMTQSMEQYEETLARQYGAATMCTLCRALRQELIAQSTASAQRTPSTAADVMPPA